MSAPVIETPAPQRTRIAVAGNEAALAASAATAKVKPAERYLQLEQPYDCTGSAKCEALGIALLESIESDDPTALVGLPLIRTAQLLRDAGIDPLGRPAAPR